jgi:hypothetical protein
LGKEPAGSQVIRVYRLEGAEEPWNWVAWEDQQINLGFSFGDDPIPAGFKFPRLVLLPEEGRRDDTADIPSHQVPGVMCVSGRAFSALAKFLTKEDQVVPLRSSLGEYYAVNVRRFINCLDPPRCKADWAEENVSAFAIYTFTFQPQTIPSSAIFRVREQSSYILITQEVVDALAAASLRGYTLEYLGTTIPSDG